MIIKPSAAIRQDYNSISNLCRDSKEPVYLTKNGEGDLVAMDIETFSKREKMLELREALLLEREARLNGVSGSSVQDLKEYLEQIIKDV